MANARRRTQRGSRTAARNMANASAAAGPMIATLESEEIHASRMVDWQKEMKYINKDLRELMIVTSILFVLLFVVGFFL